MKVSFVIPVYNRGKYLKNTLEALNFQVEYGTNDYEVVIIDDGSDEDTNRYIEGGNKNYSLNYLYLPRCSKSCIARARNYGWKAAKGDIIVFIDSDIIVREDYVKEIERCFKVSQDFLVIGTRLMLKKEVQYESILDRSFFRKYSNSTSVNELLEFRYKIFNDYSYNLSSIKYPWLLTFGCNMAVSKVWLEKVNGFDENFTKWGQEDNELSYRLYCNGVRIIINSKLEVFHQIHHGNDCVDWSKYEGVERNVNYLLSKHDQFLDMPRDYIIKLFRGEVFVDYRLLTKELKYKKTFTINNLSEIENVKKALLDLGDKEGYEIIVLDYLEDSNIDIWIQQIDCSKSVLKYYPVWKEYILNSLS